MLLHVIIFQQLGKNYMCKNYLKTVVNLWNKVSKKCESFFNKMWIKLTESKPAKEFHIISIVIPNTYSQFIFNKLPLLNNVLFHTFHRPYYYYYNLIKGEQK